MIALNTFAYGAAGATYWSHEGRGSRIDYTCVPYAAWNQVTGCTLWRHSARSLQVQRVATLRDHTPLRLGIQAAHCFSDWIPHSPSQWLREKLTATALDTSSDAAAFKVAVTDWIEAPQTQLELRTSTESSDVLNTWNLLNTGIVDIARSFFTGAASVGPNTLRECTKHARVRAQTAFSALVRADWTDFSLHGILRQWQLAAHLQYCDRKALQLRRKDWVVHNQALAEEITAAAQHNDYALTWRLVRKLSATGIGPKHRDYRSAPQENPTSAQWLQYLAQPGCFGGCRATPVRPLPNYDFALLRDLFRTPAVSSERAYQLAEQDYSAFLLRLFHAKRGRQVPRSSLPAELWRLLLLGQEDTAIDTATAIALKQLFLQIRRCNQTPLEWHHSQAALISKCDGKPGPAGYRQIHLLDPVGKCFYRGLWNKAPSHGVIGHFSTAYLPHRRREQSMVQQRIVLHRLTAAKLSHGLLIYDVRNAFPSISHDALDQATQDSFALEDQFLMTQRYRNSTTTINTADCPCTYVTGCGNLQGDSIAALQFAEVYTPCLYTYLNLKHIQPWGRKLLLTDWLTGDLVDAGFTNYADDVADIITAEDSDTLCERRFWANSILEEAIAPDLKWLLPTDCVYVTAGKAAGQKYDKEVKTAGSSQKLPKPFVYIFESLLKQAQLDPKAPDLVKVAVKKIAEKASSRADLYQIFRVCRLSKCFGGKTTRLELALVPQFNELGDYFAQTFALHAGQECYGPAPRGPIVYFVTGIVSVGTLGLVGVGAGVGYGVGSWIADKFQKKQDGERARNSVRVDEMPWAVQVALQQWTDFVSRRAAGRQLTEADVDRVWAEFEQMEPTHAANARGVVRPDSAPSSSSSSAPATFGGGPGGGPTFVATKAAEV
ncbi:unnamed protein product [Polarella glacialis]|uniref:Uncharacterized protein n=1 Tax=Polarella glacialis TaxID=89957 RepID=A0A813DUH5_POLGL|nr:unnamed protein product [Polarella glacialis]